MAEAVQNQNALCWQDAEFVSVKVKVGGTHVYYCGRWSEKVKEMKRGSRKTGEKAVDKLADEIEEGKQYVEEA